MITGFNTNVKYGDTIYHVQTEDKGLNNPLIVSLIYVKGAIVDSHRTPYRDLLKTETFSDSVLQKIVDFQHRQIVSAIKKGQFKKGMELRPYVDGSFIFQVGASKSISNLDSAANVHLSEQIIEKKTTDLAKAEITSQSKVAEQQDAFNFSSTVQSTTSTEHSNAAKPDPTSSPFTLEYSDHDGREDVAAEQGIEIRVEGSRKFIAGSHVDLRLSIESRQSKTKLENVQVVIKVIGTSLTPRLYTGKTDRLGKLCLSFNLPSYNVGSAALVIQASTSLGNSEIKYLIQKG